MSPDKPEARLTPERWREVEAIFLATRDRGPGERATFLEQACGPDVALRHEVESLLAADQGATGFLEPPGEPAPVVVDVETRLRAELAGRYTIERELGRGGMATVYLADDVRHHRRVALKVLHPELGAVLGAERFLREIGIAARLSHPHILPLHDSGRLDLGLGRPVLFYVMPYVAGRSLRERLREELQLPIDEALGIGRQIADALDHAHRQDVIHRDIKPENILLADGQAVLADFGIARALEVAGGDRLTETGLAIGTPAYMSPEQSAGSARVDGRSDIYALGCVLYEMLAGEPPFSGPTAQALLARHAMDPVPNLRTVRPTVPHALGQVVTRALAKVPADRFPTARAFAAALSQTAALSAGLTSPPAYAAVRRKWILPVAAIALLIATGVAVAWHRRPAGEATSNPKLVAILPFRVSGSNPDLVWLREGLVDLLAIKLTGEGGLHAAEPSVVLGAWRRVAGSEGRDITPEAALEIGRGLGAGSVIDGSVVSTSGHLTIAASLLTTSGDRSAAHASVEGPVDSLPSLVDQLAARLLTAEAGVDVARLSSLTTTSLPAIRAYLAGHSAFRKGHLNEAFTHYREATLLDSTFALAALEVVHTAIWVDGGEDAERARRLATEGRARLAPGDQALLDIWTSPFPTGPGFIQKWQAASNAYPDRADIWYLLGDAYYHNGLASGLNAPFRLAAEAFQRGWAIDSASGADSLALERTPIFAEPLGHMVELAQMKGDTGSVRRLVALGLAADSVDGVGWYLRWHRAVALGASAREAFWADSVRIEPWAFGQIASFITWTGIASEDYLRAAKLDILHFDAAHPGEMSASRATMLLNGGRPGEVFRLMHQGKDTVTEDLIGRIHGALFWGGDTSLAADAFRRLARRAEDSEIRGPAAKSQARTLCALSTWRAAHGDYEHLEPAISRLRAARLTGLPTNDSIILRQYSTLCAALLEASRATGLHLPEARTRLAQANDAARTYTLIATLGANLIVARLAEEQGDTALALKAVRRRAGTFESGFGFYLSTFLREEGRLAAMIGDTAGAIAAYQHYLMLMSDPEPSMKPDVEHVRGEVVKLLAEPRAVN